jgi:acetyl esterase
MSNLIARARVTVPAFSRLPVPAGLSTTTACVPTRHGTVRCVIVRPDREANDIPVMIHLHGGGFTNRYPEQDEPLARLLAAALDCAVILPDYSTGPTATYPEAEEQMADVARWASASSKTQRWDGDRLLLSGISSGAKLAINICQQFRDWKISSPVAVSLIVPIVDVVRSDRTSAMRFPAINSFVQRFIQWSYFPEVSRRHEVLASPRYDSDLGELMPPTLIQTGESDTLAAEGRELAEAIIGKRGTVTHHEYPGADHAVYATKAIAQMSDHMISFFTQHLKNDERTRNLDVA